MTIQHLTIANCRNIEAATITPGPFINVFIGDNGSGKTSLLEAIYLLGLGRSFRTTLLDRIIKTDTTSLMTVAKVGSAEQPDEWRTLGMLRTRGGESEYKIAGSRIKTLSELAKELPLQLLNANTYRLLQEGPENRRALLNFGVFHVEPLFFSLWQRYTRLLRQRNAALRMTSPDSQIRLWDGELVSVSEQIDHYREGFFNQWVVIACEMLAEFLPMRKVALKYDRGWDKKTALMLALEQSFEHDKLRKYTTQGIQRANFTALIDGTPAQYSLSLGQQKSLVAVLQLAQGLLIRRLVGRQSVYLIDDLPAELDKTTRERLLALLQFAKSQIFLTGVDESTLPSALCGSEAKMFHVEQGVFRNNVFTKV